jgi:hypothetical protein
MDARREILLELFETHFRLTAGFLQHPALRDRLKEVFRRVNYIRNNGKEEAGYVLPVLFLITCLNMRHEWDERSTLHGSVKPNSGQHTVTSLADRLATNKPGILERIVAAPTVILNTQTINAPYQINPGVGHAQPRPLTRQETTILGDLVIDSAPTAIRVQPWALEREATLFPDDFANPNEVGFIGGELPHLSVLLQH